MTADNDVIQASEYRSKIDLLQKRELSAAISRIDLKHQALSLDIWVCFESSLNPRWKT